MKTVFTDVNIHSITCENITPQSRMEPLSRISWASSPVKTVLARCSVHHQVFCAVNIGTLESPLICKEIKPVNLKEISPEYSLEGLMLKLKFQYLGHLM